MPKTIEPRSFSLSSQDNTQKTTDETAAKKRKRQSEEETKPNLNIDPRLESSFYSRLSSQFRSKD
jgi:hypothetical protein